MATAFVKYLTDLENVFDGRKVKIIVELGNGYFSEHTGTIASSRNTDVWLHVNSDTPPTFIRGSNIIVVEAVE